MAIAAACMSPSTAARRTSPAKAIADPIAMILSAAMMLRWSFGLAKEADRIERAVEKVLADGIRSMDLKSLGGKVVGTREMGAAVIARL